MNAYELISKLNNAYRGEYRGLDQIQIEQFAYDLERIIFKKDYEDIYLACLKTLKKMPKIHEIVEIIQSQGSNKFNRNKAYICDYDGTRNEYLTNVWMDKDHRPTPIEYWESFSERKIFAAGEWLTKIKDYKKYDNIMTPDVVEDALFAINQALINVRKNKNNLDK